MSDFKGEKLENDLKTKKVYRFIDTEKKIDQISKETYKKKDLIIHFPIGYEGGKKYKSIEKFSYVGFKKGLPIGVNKSATYGYGFTKKLKPFERFIDENYDFKEVIIEKGGKDNFDLKNKKLYLSDTSLRNFHNSFDRIYTKNKQEVDAVLRQLLHNLFPKKFSKPVKTYTANALSTTLASWGNSIDEFSDEDKKAIKELFDKLSITTDFLTKDTLAKTKDIIDNKYIQETLKNFDSLMILTTGGSSLEKKWQKFLKENSWIFSSIFAQPVILYKDEAYVGGKTIDNKNGKFNDFLIQSHLSNNVSFLEIKTHKTKLLENIKYRGEDVYCASKELTGCISQVLNQRDNFQKEFYQLKVKSDKDFESFNSKCVVLIGSMKDLTKYQKHSFELFRSNSRDVEILTFDELNQKIKGLQTILKNDSKK